MLAALAALAGGCALIGWIAALLWRAPAERRTREELALLRARHDEEIRGLSEAAALERVRAATLQGAAAEAQIRTRVAEAEAEDLRLRLEGYEATPCALCGVPLPFCVHGEGEEGRAARAAALEARGGGFPVCAAPAGRGPPLPDEGAPGWGLRWRERERVWREERAAVSAESGASWGSMSGVVVENRLRIRKPTSYGE